MAWWLDPMNFGSVASASLLVSAVVIVLGHFIDVRWLRLVGCLWLVLSIWTLVACVCEVLPGATLARWASTQALIVSASQTGRTTWEVERELASRIESGRVADAELDQMASMSWPRGSSGPWPHWGMGFQSTSDTEKRALAHALMKLWPAWDDGQSDQWSSFADGFLDVTCTSPSATNEAVEFLLRVLDYDVQHQGTVSVCHALSAAMIRGLLNEDQIRRLLTLMISPELIVEGGRHDIWRREVLEAKVQSRLSRRGDTGILDVVTGTAEISPSPFAGTQGRSYLGRNAYQTIPAIIQAPDAPGTHTLKARVTASFSRDDAKRMVLWNPIHFPRSINWERIRDASLTIDLSTSFTVIEAKASDAKPIDNPQLRDSVASILKARFCAGYHKVDGGVVGETDMRIESSPVNLAMSIYWAYGGREYPMGWFCLTRGQAKDIRYEAPLNDVPPRNITVIYRPDIGLAANSRVLPDYWVGEEIRFPLCTYER